MYFYIKWQISTTQKPQLFLHLPNINRKRSTSKLYIVTLLIQLLCRAHMRNAGLEEAPAGIKIAGRNINNLRYADDTTVMVESEEELKSLLMKVKEESEKTGLNSAFKK